jgi:hypothetical protein
MPENWDPEVQLIPVKAPRTGGHATPLAKSEP